MKTFFSNLVFFLMCSFFFLVFSSLSYAGFQMSATRVIMKPGTSKAGFTITNKGKTPILLQVFLTNANPGLSVLTKRVRRENPKSTKKLTGTPFFLVWPQLIRIPSGDSYPINVLYNGVFGKHLPRDRESVFWINIQDIPMISKKPTSGNYLKISVRQRIKFFYRPSGIVTPPEKAFTHMRWFMCRKGGRTRFFVQNDSVYNITFAGLPVIMNESGKTIARLESGMIFSKIEVKENIIHRGKRKHRYSFPKSDAFYVKYAAINDYGGKTSFQKSRVKYISSNSSRCL